MDYEAIDRDMSSWVLTARRLTTRFFLTDEGFATDILARARRYRWLDEAEIAATTENADSFRWGMTWKPIRVPGALSVGA